MPHELKGIETALAGLTPDLGLLNRDRLLFEAGRRSARASWYWPLLSFGFATLSATLGALLLWQVPAEVPARVTPTTVILPPVQSPASEATSPSTPSVAGESDWRTAFQPTAGLIGQRDRVLRFGVDALPKSTPPAPRGIVPLTRAALDDLLKSS